MNCSVVARDELAERYLLGELSPAEQEAYEKHYFDCASCFAELRRLQDVREVLRSNPPAAPVPWKRAARYPRWSWVMAGAIAVSLVAVVLLRQTEAPESMAGGPRAAVPTEPAGSPGVEYAESSAAARTVVPSAEAVPPAAVASHPSHRAELLARLARFEPPRYVPSVLRGAADQSTVSFQKAMKAYVAGNYGTAVPILREAAGLEPARPDIAFFLGASELLSGKTDGAITAFERTIAMGDTPFMEEARLYLAKAYLKRGDVERARAELETLKSLRGEWASEADAILTQLAGANSEE